MTRLVWVAINCLLLQGCMSTTALLTQAELAAFERLQVRLQDNRAAIHQSLDDLLEIGRQAIAEQHALSTSLAKAQLLESMKSPWAHPSPDLASTQKEVSLYYLYALAESQRDLQEARVREEDTAIQRVREGYDRLITLTGKALEKEKAILGMQKDIPAQFVASLAMALSETKAFRERLEASQDTSMAAVGRNVQKAEERVAKLTELIQRLVYPSLDPRGN
jgi:hypothetical protein